MLKGLGSLVAPGPGRGVIVIGGQVGAEVGLSGSHLGEPSCVELVETYQGVRFERGGVWVLSRD